MSTDQPIRQLSTGQPVLHAPGCEFLRPDGIACTCGAFDRVLGRDKLPTTTTKETTVPNADEDFGPSTLPRDECPNDNHGVGCTCHRGDPIKPDMFAVPSRAAKAMDAAFKQSMDESLECGQITQTQYDKVMDRRTTGERARAICETAADLVNNDRNAVYGDAEVNFTETGALWAVVFGHDVTPEQVAICMSLVKVARLIKSPGHADSWTDGVGYLALGGGIAAKPGRHS